MASNEACRMLIRSISRGPDHAQATRALERHYAAAGRWEELVQLLRCGSAASALHWMMELGLLEELLPEAEAWREKIPESEDETPFDPDPAHMPE